MSRQPVFYTAWTLGEPTSYAEAIRIPGNAKAPGGYAFRTREDAEAYAASHPEAAKYKPFAMLLPEPFAECTTRDAADAAQALHVWHQAGGNGMYEADYCHVCTGAAPTPVDCDVLLTEAPFVMPA